MFTWGVFFGKKGEDVTMSVRDVPAEQGKIFADIPGFI